MKRTIIISMIIIAMNGLVTAKIDLVTLPTRDTVQLTIYNSADLTLARESRALTLREGSNKLQFSWANTLIDPTSLDMLPKANADKIDISDLTYPPRVRELGLWNINSGISGKVPVEISYLTSGLGWRAFYMGTLSSDEKTMRLQGYVRVKNNSGEDYENAQTRLIVGKVHILDRIAELARRQHPYGRPGQPMPMAGARLRSSGVFKKEMETIELGYAYATSADEIKEIKKEGLSEYFLYTIEGTETIANGWSKRLPSFEVMGVPVVNLYKFEQERFGQQVVRFLSFMNDEDHKLGDTPIPGGALKVYRGVEDGHLSYQGQSSFKYIPVDEDVELNLGGVANVVVEPKLMDYKTENYKYNSHRDVAGWDEVRTFKVEVKNTRDVPVKVEIRRNFRTVHWDIEKTNIDFENIDMKSIKYVLELDGRTNKDFEYTVRTYHGRREDDSPVSRKK